MLRPPHVILQRGVLSDSHQMERRAEFLGHSGGRVVN